MNDRSVHGLSKRDIFRKALALKKEGRLFSPGNPHYEEAFKGSIDRFCEIAFALGSLRRVLDAGCGDGLLLSLLSELGHECHGIDANDVPRAAPEIYLAKGIEFRKCNLEVDPIPYANDFFDAVVCCQTLEHFTHSHPNALREIRRVLKPGGLLEIDVPNAACFRNRSRLLRGKHITWDYRKAYLYAEPVHYEGLSFYPDRHNREFTIDEVRTLLDEADFRIRDIRFPKLRRYREGLESIRSLGSAFRDLVPSFRKSIVAFGEKIPGGLKT